MLSTFILIASTGAAVFDLRWRRIPNWLVVGTIAVSLGWHTVANGLAGLWTSGAGLLVGTAVLFPFFLLRGMGAGDVKFFGAIGAAVTFPQVLTVLFFAAIVAGVMAVVQALIGRVFLRTVGSLAGLIGWFLRGNLTPHPTLNLSNRGVLAVPFGVSIAAATWVFVLFGKQ